MYFNYTKLVYWLSACCLALGLSACQKSNPYYQADRPHHTPTGFQNLQPEKDPKGWLDVLKWKMNSEKADNTGVGVPQVEADLSLIQRPLRNQALWIGHSTVLVQAEGLSVLADPIFSERASPFSFIGPKRHQPPAVSIGALPSIDVVIISHAHYDHLDEASIKQLAQQPSGSPLFLVPLGVERILQDWQIERVQALDWWDEYQVGEVTFTLTPTQHWSARGLFDRNQTLWGSWAVTSPTSSWFFTGDTGYQPRIFKDIRQKIAPQGFDVAFIPIGAYQPRWFMGDQHVDPEQAIQIHVDLASRYSVAIHWGTFSLADERLDQPAKDLATALQQANLSSMQFAAIPVGENITFARPVICPTPPDVGDVLKTLDKASNSAGEVIE